MNGKRLDFSQHTVNCIKIIQRVWRLSFRHKTTSKLMAVVRRHNFRYGQLSHMRYDEIRTILHVDKRWREFLLGVGRLVFLCLVRCAHLLPAADSIRSRKHKVAWFKFTYINANADFNAFVETQYTGGKFKKMAIDVLQSLEVLLDHHHISADGDDIRISSLDRSAMEDFVLKINENHKLAMTEVLRAREFVIPIHVDSLNLCKAMDKILRVRWFEPSSSSINSTLSLTMNYLNNSIKRMTDTVKYRKVDDAVEKNTNFLCGWHRFNLSISLIEFLNYEILLDRKFVFDLHHESVSVCTGMFDRHLSTVIKLIASDLVHGINSTDSIVHFIKLLEAGVVRVAVTAGRRALARNFSFGRLHIDWRAGKINTWEGAIQMMDTVVEDVHSVFDQARQYWATKREDIVMKNPNPTTAFVKGLSELVHLQRMAMVHVINTKCITPALLGRTDEYYHTYLRQKFDHRHHESDLQVTIEALQRTLDTHTCLKDMEMGDRLIGTLKSIAQVLQFALKTISTVCPDGMLCISYQAL